MHLIIIVIALFAERAFGQLKRWRETDGFARYVAFIERSRLGARWLSHASGVLVIVPPVLVVALAQWAVVEYLWLGFELVFGVLVLMLTFGPRDLWEDVYALAHARGEADHDQAEARAVALCRRTTGRAATDIEGHTIVGAVLIQGHERVLAVLLWFFLAGPAGAVFYRSVRELPALAARGTGSKSLRRAAEYVHGAAAWFPARLIVLVYAIVGDTRRALAAWPAARATTHLSAAASWRLLAVVGRGALALPRDTRSPRFERQLNDTLLEALGLISRALLVLLAGLALLIIFGVLR
ncbi:regulatory signaling modulator protein AmpE [Salinisphaera aquimarina]|uniref:Regulatory signaling modulator protein AmpE n=1 Tax=Salinisphaera aquimarina TaxID=2094031 RepID=A0ABV7ENR5_9GAMM